MLDFKKFVRSESTLEDLGTVKENAGKKGSIAFIPSNFTDSSKRVALVITNAAGQSAVVPCSEKVSKALRAKEMNVKQLAGLSILKNEDGRLFISMPAGTEGLAQISVDTLKVEAVAPVTAASLEELIAF